MMKKIVAVVLTVLLFTGSVFASPFVRYDSMKQYPWYGKYQSYNWGGSGNVIGAESQYTEMHMYYDRWQELKELQLQANQAYYDALAGKVGLSDGKDRVASILGDMTVIVSGVYGIDPNDWIADDVTLVQAAHDKVQGYSSTEDRNFTQSVFAEYTNSVALAWRSAKTRDLSHFRKYGAGAWSGIVYYGKMMQTLCNGMYFTQDGFKGDGRIGQMMKPSVVMDSFYFRDQLVKEMGGEIPAALLADPQAQTREVTVQELAEWSKQVKIDKEKKAKELEAKIEARKQAEMEYQMARWGEIAAQVSPTPDGYDTKGFWYDKPGWQVGGVKEGMWAVDIAMMKKAEKNLPYPVQFIYSEPPQKAVKAYVRWIDYPNK